MAKILTFKAPKSAEERQAEKLVKVADEIDAVLIRHLGAQDVDPRDLAGVLSHRLGTLMRHIEEKTELWDVCQRVLKREAHLE